MGGKASIIMVMGFSVASLFIRNSINQTPIDAYDNYVSYYVETNARINAASVANIAGRKIIDYPTWRGTRSFQIDAANSSSYSVMDSGYNRLRLDAQGKNVFYDAEVGTAKIMGLLEPSSFSRYAYYSVNEGSIWWTSGDTVWGPMHTQSRLNVANQPVFKGAVTSLGTLRKYNSSASPIFEGGYKTGVDLPIPATLTNLVSQANNGGKNFSSSNDLYLIFNNDSVQYRSGSSGAYTKVKVTDLAPNGVIITSASNLHVLGTVKGKYTIGATSTASGKGNVYIEGNIVYSVPPILDEATNTPNPACTDLLGIVAEKNIIIPTSIKSPGITIHASMFCRSGSFYAQNYDSRTVDGIIHLVGGVQQKDRGAVGQFSGSTITNGFSKNYRYDQRLQRRFTPPAYPTTGYYVIVSWWE